MSENSLPSTFTSDGLRIDVLADFWQSSDRPENILPGLRQITVPVPAGIRLEQVLGGVHSPRLWLRYGHGSTTGSASRGIPPPGNLCAFRRASMGEELLIKDGGTGLAGVSVLDSCLRPSKNARAEQLLVTDSEQKCSLWDNVAKHPLAWLSLDQMPLRSVFSGDGKLLAMGFSDGIVRIWRLLGGGASEEAVRFELINKVLVGRAREAQAWALGFAPSGQSLYMVKIAQRKHIRARLGVEEKEAELLTGRGPEDWVTGLAINSGSPEEVCFAGLGRYGHYHLRDRPANEPIAIGREETTFVQSLQFVSSVQGANQPSIMKPRGLIIACAPQSAWLADLTQSDDKQARILAETTLADPEARFHRVGLDGNTLFAIVVRQQN